jgi:hypothetical protein
VTHFLHFSERQFRRKYPGFRTPYFFRALSIRSPITKLLCAESLFAQSIVIFSIVALSIIAGSSVARAQNGGRPVPDLLPEIRADAAVAEVGKPLRIDVLANDIGVPSEGEPAPEMRVEGVPPCATVQVDGRVLIFRGGADCVGADVVFGYGVRIQGNWLGAAVTVTVKPAVIAAAAACDVPESDWRMTRLEGGSFDKSSAPPGIIDFADLIDEASFSVPPLCITLESVPAEPVERYFNNLREEDRRDQYPELTAPPNVPTAPVMPGRIPAIVSQRMAMAFAKRTGERNSRPLALPTLQEYIGAAWELQAKHRGAPETDAFLIAMRSGNLQWTSSPCGSPGSYWTIGPSTLAGAQGKLVKLCYELSRIDRTGFRLVIRQ